MSTATANAGGSAPATNRAPVASRVDPAIRSHGAAPVDEVASVERAEALDALGRARRGPLARVRDAQGHHQERRIARRLAARDPQALADLHALTGRAAFSVILSVVGDRGHAEDVHQQVYAELWRRAEQFDASRGTLLSWVLTIARSRAIDHLRRRREQPVADDALMALGGGAEDPSFDDVLNRAYVAQALEQVPERERELLRLRFWDGLTQTEIAERTGQPLGTVKSRMLSGLRTLRLLLDAETGA
ncbi:MAG: sigma-70 family RNA polymerase sigma factor [Solirubrobacteraceae bacterium]|nr:sigma-70 family RNA polymerase sigma factor [Solirubrobacteraceae bacterium]